MIQLPIRTPAPVVSEHAAVFRDLFENQCQFRRCQHDLTGLIVLPNKSLANMARCILDSADTTNLSRFLAEAPGRGEAVNRSRVRFKLQEAKPNRLRCRESLVVIDDTLCEHVVCLFDHMDRHYHHSYETYPLAHNPVARFSVSGPVRFLLALGLSHRHEELTRWEAALRGLFAVAPDVSVCQTGSNEGPHPHHAGRLAATGVCGAPEALMCVHDQLSHSTRVARVLTQLFAKQQGTVPVSSWVTAPNYDSRGSEAMEQD